MSWLTPSSAPEQIAVLDAPGGTDRTGGENRSVWQRFQFWFTAFIGVLGLCYVVF